MTLVNLTVAAMTVVYVGDDAVSSLVRFLLSDFWLFFSLFRLLFVVVAVRLAAAVVVSGAFNEVHRIALRAQ